MTQAKPNWPLLAAIRFFLALVVAFDHAHFALAQGLPKCFERLNGNVAVYLFLIISGFSMRASYEREPENFYRRRFWRVAPVYWFAVAISFVPFMMWGPVLSYDFGLAHYLPTFFHTAFFSLGLQPIVAPMLSVNAPLWTLGVEIGFYAAVPLLAKANYRVTLGLIAISAVVFATTRYSLIIWLNPLPYAAMFWPFGLGWILFGKPLDSWSRGLCLAIPAAMAAVKFPWDIPPVLMCLAVCCLIIWGHKIELTPRLKAAGIYLGDLSFPMYAVHSVVICCLVFLYTGWPYHLFIIPTLLLSTLTLHLIDRPLRKLGHRNKATVPEVQPAAVTAH